MCMEYDESGIYDENSFGVKIPDFEGTWSCTGCAYNHEPCLYEFTNDQDEEQVITILQYGTLYEADSLSHLGIRSW